MIKRTFAALALSCVLLGSTRSEAAFAISSFTPTNTGTAYGDYTFGYSFSLSQTVYVTSLSLFDSHGAGALQDSHQLGIFAAGSNTNLVTRTLDSTSAVTSIGGQSFASVSLGASFVTLGPGTYNIGAFYARNSADALVFSSNGLTTGGPELAYNYNAYHSNGFAAPSNAGPPFGGYIGPDFTYQLTSPTVPEPSSIVLTSLGAAGLFVGRLARRKAKVVA